MKSYNPGQQSVWNQYVYNGVDRKDNHVGYTYDNCLPCCGACNHMKGKKLYAEFTDWIGRVVAFKRHQNKVIVLVGMIASGKSTYCKNAARSGQLVVNDDSLVNMLHADDYTLYDKKLKTLYKSLENQAIGQILSMGRSVLVDRGLNCSAAGRQRWVALAKSFDVPCEAIVFSNDGPETHAHRRTASDARGHPLEYWLRVANLHHDEYQVPKFAEGFCKIHTISFAEIQEGRVIE